MHTNRCEGPRSSLVFPISLSTLGYVFERLPTLNLTVQLFRKNWLPIICTLSVFIYMRIYLMMSKYIWIFARGILTISSPSGPWLGLHTWNTSQLRSTSAKYPKRSPHLNDDLKLPGDIIRGRPRWGGTSKVSSDALGRSAVTRKMTATTFVTHNMNDTYLNFVLFAVFYRKKYILMKGWVNWKISQQPSVYDNSDNLHSSTYKQTMLLKRKFSNTPFVLSCITIIKINEEFRHSTIAPHRPQTRNNFSFWLYRM